MSGKGNGRSANDAESSVPLDRQPRKRFDKWVVMLEQTAAAGLLAGIIGLIFAQVVARYVFNSPLYWSDELARYAYVWLTFLSATFVLARDEHIRVDLLSWTGHRTQAVIGVLGKLIVIGTFVFFIWGSWPWLLSNIVPRSSALRMPLIYLFGVVWVCFGLMAFHETINLLRHLTHRTARNRLDDL